MQEGETVSQKTPILILSIFQSYLILTRTAFLTGKGATFKPAEYILMI